MNKRTINALRKVASMHKRAGWFDDLASTFTHLKARHFVPGSKPDVPQDVPAFGDRSRTKFYSPHWENKDILNDVRNQMLNYYSSQRRVRSSDYNSIGSHFRDAFGEAAARSNKYLRNLGNLMGEQLTKGEGERIGSPAVRID